MIRLKNSKCRPILSVAALAMIFLIPVHSSAQTWSRSELRGTGISIESPVPFKLGQDKPDPFLEHQVALVRWSLSHSGVFATVTYEKVVRDQKTPRQKMNETAELFRDNNGSTVARVTDTQWRGEPAALFEETFYDRYAKQNTGRRMICFGKAGELITLNVTWNTADPKSKIIAERLLNSAQRAGSVAAETSKAPPAGWTRLNFRGLLFETPSPTLAPDCNAPIPIRGIDSSKTCFRWGNELSITINYYGYGRLTAPSPAQTMRIEQEGLAKIVSESTLRTTSESTNPPISVPGGEAVRTRNVTVYGTVASVQEWVYIRRGGDSWTVHLSYMNRWEFTEAAAKRVLGSLSLQGSNSATNAQPPVTRPPATSTRPPVRLTANDYLNRASAAFKRNDDAAAEREVNEAIRLDPKLAAAYLLRAKIYCAKKLMMTAMRDEEKAFELGSAIDYRCGRSGGPVPR